MPGQLDLSPASVKARVDARIRETLAETALAVAPAGGAGTEMIDVLAASAHGGKRLRALLTIAAHAAHGGTRDEAAVSVAAALEWFQTAALIHDDVLDGSDTRRGQPAAHRRFEAILAVTAEPAIAAALGRSAGVLAGDVALMTSHRVLDAALVELPDPRPVASLFAAMSELVTAGQYLDMRLAGTPLQGLGDQREQIVATMRCKTASYSAEAPLALGAAVAGADATRVDAMKAIGVPLGIAFQLRDDILGLVGAPAVTGKPAGDDVREGKRTLLLWHAWTEGTETQRLTISRALGDREAEQSTIDDAVAAIVDAGGVAAAEREIDALASPALHDLDALTLEAEGAAALRDLAVGLTTRAS
ncbi:polyprenyl synthetase family protein [Demequina salsinemoris]|uniref:polyprenyl synthetase family protein n=1 Tax=Demequina salsinemoris TaxID=577470 RepID=UPI00078454B2|nr:polyprenyl synthetase family protein [Demequina salsinemoris]